MKENGQFCATAAPVTRTPRDLISGRRGSCTVC